jgi:protoporphyrinogen oxidase
MGAKGVGTDANAFGRAGAGHVPLLVLGAGPTGIGAAWRLRALGSRAPEWLVLEAADRVGGLARTVVDDAGYRWDLGGHVIYSHAAEFDRMLEAVVPSTRRARVERAGFVWHHDRFVPTPFQQHLDLLPAPERARCLEGLAERAPAADASFDSWILEQFGPGLAEVFFRPFNFKMWATPTTALDRDWVTHRSGSGATNVPTVDGRDPEPAVPSREDVSFPYPEGGTGEIWSNAARAVGLDRFAFGTTVVAVDAGARAVHLASGARITYDALVSALPLDRLLAMLVDPGPLRELGTRLVHSSTNLVGLGIEGDVPDALAPMRWLYFPDPAVPFHRVTVLSNYSPGMVPDGARAWSLLCEVSESPTRPLDAAHIVDDVVDQARRLLRAWGGGRIAHVWSKRLEHGYPTPFLGRSDVLPAVHSTLEALGIVSRGRFGGWRYEISNQDHAFMQGFEAVGRVVCDEPESVFVLDRAPVTA